MNLRTATAVALLFLLAGCTSADHVRRVPDQVVAELPYPSRVALLDEEGDVAEAVQLAAENEAAEGDLHRRLKQAEERSAATPSERGSEANKLATLAAQEAQARVEYLHGELEGNSRRKHILALQYRCAVARLERAKVRQAQRAAVKDAKAVHLEEFEHDAQACEEELAELRERDTLATEPVRAAEQRWREAQDSLQAASELQPSPYVH